MASTSVIRRCQSFCIRTRHYYAGARKNTLPSSALHLGYIPNNIQPICNPPPHSVICPSLMVYLLSPKSESRSSDKTVSFEKRSMKRVHPFSLYRAIRSDPEGHLLGIDVCSDAIKLAVTCLDNKHFPRFLRVLYRDIISMDSLAEELKKVISRHSIVGFVFGCGDYLDDPDNENITPYTQSVQVRRFVEELSETGKLGEMKYAYWDNTFANERFNLLLLEKKDNHTRMRTIRECPPRLILQDFLEDNLDRWDALARMPLVRKRGWMN